MQSNNYKKPLILGILFFLPVLFLLILYPSTHNYDPLEIINTNVEEISIDEDMMLKDHLTVLAFFGKKPMDKAMAASNLKELIYDKFKGFKKFQIVVVLPQGMKPQASALYKEIAKYEDLKFWHFVYHNDADIQRIYNSLQVEVPLDTDLSTDHVFIIDKELNQRGRLDDRENNEKKNNREVYGLSSYDCIEIAELKNKMTDDLRILFTEYRQKRKGNFNSSKRRKDDINTNEQD